MSETDTMANDAVGGDSNWTSNSSNGVGDSNRARDSNRVGDSMANNRSNIRVDSSAIVGDLGNVAIGIVSVVVDVLDPAVGKSNGVRTLTLAGAIVGLSSVEVGVGVVVSDGVLVGVGGDLVGVDRNSVGYSVTHHGMADTNTMADANTMSDANAMTESSKQLGASRGSGEEGGEG